MREPFIGRVRQPLPRHPHLPMLYMTVCPSFRDKEHLNRAETTMDDDGNKIRRMHLLKDSFRHCNDFRLLLISGHRR